MKSGPESDWDAKGILDEPRGEKKMDKEIYDFVKAEIKEKLAPLNDKISSLEQANKDLNQELENEKKEKAELKKASEDFKQELKQEIEDNKLGETVSNLQDRLNALEEKQNSHEHNISWNPEQIAQDLTGNEQAMETLKQVLSDNGEQEQQGEQEEEGEVQQEEEPEEQSTGPFLSMEKLKELKADQ